MKTMKKINYFGLLFAASGLVACGGGDGSTSSQAVAIDGLAATGAPMASATISVFDATGSLVVEGVVVGADGMNSKVRGSISCVCVSDDT